MLPLGASFGIIVVKLFLWVPNIYILGFIFLLQKLGDWRKGIRAVYSLGSVTSILREIIWLWSTPLVNVRKCHGKLIILYVMQGMIFVLSPTLQSTIVLGRLIKHQTFWRTKVTHGLLFTTGSRLMILCSSLSSVRMC